MKLLDITLSGVLLPTSDTDLHGINYTFNINFNHRNLTQMNFIRIQ